MSERVRFLGGEPSGLGEVVVSLVRANLVADPERGRHLDGAAGVVRIVATDTSDELTLELRDGQLRVYAGASAPADAELVGASDALLAAVASPRLGPFPNPFTRGGARTIARLLAGDLAVTGVFRSRRLLRRVRGLLTTDAVDAEAPARAEGRA